MFGRSIRNALIALSIGTLAISLVQGYFGLTRLEIVAEGGTKLSSDIIPGIFQISGLNASLGDLRVAESEAVMAASPEALAQARKQVGQALERIGSLSREYEPTIPEDGTQERETWNKIAAGIADYQKMDARLMELADRGPAGVAEAAALYSGDMKSSYDGYGDVLDKLIDMHRREAAEVDESNQTVLKWARVLLLAAGAAAAMAATANMLFAHFRVSSPIKQMTDAMVALAGGDLQAQNPGKGRRDEIGEMAKAVEVFRANAVERENLAAAARRERQEAQRREREESDRLAAEMREGERQAQTEARRLAEQHEIERAVVSEVGAALERLAARDLTYRLTGRLPDAYAKLQSDFNAAASALEQAMTDVVDGSQAIGAMSGEIAVGADELARRTEQQAATIEETAAAMEELAVTVRASAEGAGRAAEIVRRAKDDAEQGGVVVAEAVAAMGSIKKSSRDIGGVVDLIEQIAFQTNLLALNASVEAARAGEAGRGFAVVASEVRALSQRSAEAAKEINALISSSSAQVVQGVELVGRTGGVLERMIAQVQEIDRLIDNMATASGEQALTLSEVGKAITTLDHTTQKNATMVDQTSAATRALDSKGNELLRPGRSLHDRRSGDLSAAPRRSIAPPMPARLSPEVALEFAGREAFLLPRRKAETQGDQAEGEKQRKRVMAPNSPLVSTFVQPMKVGLKAEPAAPMELITAIAPARAPGPKTCVGTVQNSARKENMPTAAIIRTRFVASGRPAASGSAR